MEPIYTPASKIYNVSYEDFPGLLIKCKSSTLGEIRALGQSGNVDSQNQFFASRIVSWNMGHPPLKVTDAVVCPMCSLAESSPLPVTAEALLCLDFDFLLALIAGYMSAVTRVSVPKGLNLNLGETAQEDLMRQLAQLQNPPISLPLNSTLE